MNQRKAEACLPPNSFRPPHLLSGYPKGTPILVAYSGGADSTALLSMLCDYGKETDTPICAAHVNHGIRGAEADRDESFCRETAKRLGVKLFVTRVDVPALAKERNESIETAAREARYEFFSRIMGEEQIPLLATAHNAEDNLETLLHRLLRGSGLSGISGIPECRSMEGGRVIRPLLEVSRDEILDYCRSAGLSYVTDSTNTDGDYMRNRIRATVVPALKELSPTVAKSTARLCRGLRADAFCLQSMADLFLEGFRAEDGIELEKLNGSPESVVSRALMTLHGELSREALEQVHVDALRRLCERGIPHSRLDLPGGVEAVIEGDRLLLRQRQELREIPPYSLPLPMNSDEVLTISQTNCELVIAPSQISKIIYKNSILLSIDSDKIIGSLSVRGRLGGDRILLRGMHRSVKKLMCDLHVPVELRGRLPVICDGGGIVAIPFLGVRDDAKPSAESRSVCEILVNLQ